MLGLFAQNAYTERVESTDREPFRQRWVNQTLDPIIHLTGGLVCESQRHNIKRLVFTVAQQIRNFLCNDSCFARTSPSQDQARAVQIQHRLALGWIQSICCKR